MVLRGHGRERQVLHHSTFLLCWNNSFIPNEMSGIGQTREDILTGEFGIIVSGDNIVYRFA